MHLAIHATTSAVTARATLNARDTEAAIARALNKAATQARTAASRKVRAAGYNLKASAIRRSFTHHRATRTKLETSLRATGLPITLINYDARQTKAGVSVRVKNGRKTIAHAFIAIMPNGHTGVFQRESNGYKRVRKNGRAYSSGLPIRELYGPSIPDALLNDTVQKALKNLINQKYPVILNHEIDLLMRSK